MPRKSLLARADSGQITKPPEHLRAWRKRAGFSLQEAGQRLGITHTTLLRWERGESHVTFQAMLRLAEIYGATSISDLISPPPKSMDMEPEASEERPTLAESIRLSLKSSVSRRLRAIREELGLTKGAMAVRLGVGRTRYLHWESLAPSGNFPAIESMISLCEFLPGLTMDFIYRGKLDAVPYALALRLNAHMNCQSADTENG